MTLPTAEPAKPPEVVVAGTVATRVWDAVKNLATISENLKTLEREDTRIQGQLLELSRTVLELTKDVRDMIGQMKGIEKRLEDKDKLIEMTIRARIMEEFEKLRADTHRN
jgi:septal ring factor EnvC (AmiA/AmiB activator)